MVTNFLFRARWRAAFELARRRDSAEIEGALERPDRRQPYSRWVDVRGWAFRRDGAPLAIEIRLNRTLLATLAPDVARPDLAERFPSVPAARTAGFATVLPARALGNIRRGWLNISAAATSPKRERRLLGLSRIERVSLSRGRAAYQFVWDAASRSLSDARFSVAGTADASELERSGESTARDVAQSVGITTADVVLEIGCGVGRVGKALAPRCGRWMGADVSANMLRYARAALDGHPNVSFVHLNGVDLGGVADGSIDVVYCTAVFMHLDEWDRFRYLTEAYRVLKPGGRLYVDNFNLLSPEGWAVFEQNAVLDPAARPANISKASTPEELRAYASHAGFVDLTARTGGLWVTITARRA